MRNLWLNRRPTLGWLAVAALFVFPIFSLSGAVDMFLKLGDLKGESIDSKHGGEIDVLAWNWGMSQSGSFQAGGGGGAGKANVQDISVTKWIDQTSPELMLHVLNGDHFSDATLTVRKAGKIPLEYIKIELKQVMVTSVSTGGSGGEDRLTEKVTLNFASFRLTYIPQGPDGTAGTAVKVEWNIAGNAPGY